ncbi:MAG: DNA-binding response regulator [Proteobacteria bacterium]|nr:DNA-binding response regulator [Pseudomonadota bacterium]NDC23590.1 DNA-binding response regulator [Pseudomonadota bacterium]NDD03682.1 DNA-binding response regulator [Pseudomonadota bacterium]NDG25777.1 DNA-binding response regulator [Pseudomonadota bacterium]
MDKILVIEDNKDFQFLIQTALSGDYKVMCSDNGRQGVEMAQELKPDLIILDISLGEMDGFEVCHLLKNNKETAQVPIIFLSSRNDTHSKVMGFDLGAEDFLEKPFETGELKARVKVRLRQSQARRENLSSFEVPGLRIDFIGHRVFIEEKQVLFSALEFKLLSYFVRHPDRVLTREKILNSVWGVDTFVTDRVVDSHIRSIRKKLGSHKDHIESIYGEGYRFNPHPASLSKKSKMESEAA